MSPLSHAMVGCSPWLVARHRWSPTLHTASCSSPCCDFSVMASSLPPPWLALPARARHRGALRMAAKMGEKEQLQSCREEEGGVRGKTDLRSAPVMHLEKTI